MDLINALIDIVAVFFVAYLIARMVVSYMLLKIKVQIQQEIGEFVDRIDSGNLIPVTVEVDQNQYFCYNAFTKDFVVQGFDITEIATNFSARFPDKKMAIYNGDEVAVKALKSQLEKVYEDFGSK